MADQPDHGHKKLRESRRIRAFPPPAPGAAMVMAAMAITLVLGGGGTSNPGTEMALQPLVAVLFALPLLFPRLSVGLGPVPRWAWAITGLLLVIPVLQLIPLPPAVWRALPGRELEVSGLDLVDAGQHWMPWTISPARTFVSLLAMIVPALFVVQIARLNRSGRLWLCITVGATGLLSILLGVLQISRTGGYSWSLYSYYHVGAVVGFHANHNAEADMLGITLMALGAVVVAALLGRHRTLVWVGAGLALIICCLATFMTGSRTGIALIPLGMAVYAAMLWPLARISRMRRWLWIAGGSVVAAGAAIGAVELHSVQRVLGRFSIIQAGRLEIWTDAVYALKSVWPMGSGVGTFPLLLNAAERLEVVRPTTAARAHCDWLEWAIEGGFLGLVVLAAALGIVGMLAWRAWRGVLSGHSGPIERAQTLLASGILLQLGLHALDDFPMRSMALACLAAMAAALLTNPPALAPVKEDGAPPADDMASEALPSPLAVPQSEPAAQPA